MLNKPEIARQALAMQSWDPLYEASSSRTQSGHQKGPMCLTARDLLHAANDWSLPAATTKLSLDSRNGTRQVLRDQRRQEQEVTGSNAPSGQWTYLNGYSQVSSNDKRPQTHLGHLAREVTLPRPQSKTQCSPLPKKQVTPPKAPVDDSPSHSVQVQRRKWPWVKTPYPQ